jgi:hypothetical protein
MAYALDGTSVHKEVLLPSTKSPLQVKHAATAITNKSSGAACREMKVFACE